MKFQTIGHSEAKRGMEIALTGTHSILLIGPPGCGKGLLSQDFKNIAEVIGTVFPLPSIAKSRPCPCGFLNDSIRGCRCTTERQQIFRAELRLLAESVDMSISMQQVPVVLLSEGILRPRSFQERQEDIATTAERIKTAQGKPRPAEFSDAAIVAMNNWASASAPTARRFHAISAIAITIAQMDGSLLVEQKHVAEAIRYAWK